MADISSSNFASWARQLITLITRLRALGAQADFDLPRIAVIGNQSAGKSSLVEAISGISVPRAHGTCTRCPMECRLQSNSSPWQCQVRLRRETDENGQRIPVTEEPFGPLLHDKAELEEMIRRAQLAILNPSLPTKFFETFDTKSLPSGHKPPGSARQLAFSSNVVCLDLSGPDLPDLSFIDLPGIISTVDKGEDKTNIAAVRSMVEEHIQGNTLILLTITMRDDMNNQGAAHLAQLADPSGSRTIGVLTKPDLIQEGEEDTWLKILEGSSHQLKHGYFITKHPSPKELDEHITHEQAREREAKFFETTVPWSNKSDLRLRMGTPNLTRELSNLLGALINRSLPSLRANAKESLDAVHKALDSLPPPPSDNPVLELLRMVSELSSDLDALVRGSEGSERLLQECRPAHQQLKYDILSTQPNFRPFRNAAEDDAAFSVEVDADDALDARRKRKRADGGAPVYLDDVRDQIARSLTRQLPFNVPFSVKAALIARCFEQWDAFCMRCFDAVHAATAGELARRAQAHFGAAGSAMLLADVRMHCDDLVKRHREKTLEIIRFFLKLEDTPFTVNDHYFSACRDKYLAQYKAARKAPLADVAKADVQTALASLAQIGINVSAADLAKLHKEDMYEEELVVMAETAAYFRVAYKRVIDDIPRIIDHGFMRAVAQDLRDVLTAGLGLGEAGATERAAAYLAEDVQVTADRKHLTLRKEKLDAVLRELARFQHAVAPAARMDLDRDDGAAGATFTLEDERSTTASSSSPSPAASAPARPAAHSLPPRPVLGPVSPHQHKSKPVATPKFSPPSTQAAGVTALPPKPSSHDLWGPGGIAETMKASAASKTASGTTSAAAAPVHTFNFGAPAAASEKPAEGKAAPAASGRSLFGSSLTPAPAPGAFSFASPPAAADKETAGGKAAPTPPAGGFFGAKSPSTMTTSAAPQASGFKGFGSGMGLFGGGAAKDA